MKSRRRPIGKVPLDRALSKLGIASRTVAAQWIAEGRVKVNGVLRKDRDFWVTPETAKIEIDEQKQNKQDLTAFLLHKPRGVVTTRSDEKGRPTVFSLLQAESTEYSHLHSVGRLDLATTGVLIITNDTRLSSWLTDPINGIQRTYLVSVQGKVTEEEVKKMNAGIVESGERLKPEKIVLRKASGKESHLTVILKEGKNREIRRIFDYFEHPVLQLKRVAYGGIDLGDLAPGKYRSLSREEIRKAFPGAPVR